MPRLASIWLIFLHLLAAPAPAVAALATAAVAGEARPADRSAADRSGQGRASQLLPDARRIAPGDPLMAQLAAVPRAPVELGRDGSRGGGPTPDRSVAGAHDDVPRTAAPSPLRRAVLLRVSHAVAALGAPLPYFPTAPPLHG